MWRWEVWHVGGCVLYKEGECGGGKYDLLEAVYCIRRVNVEVGSMACGRMCTV